MAAHDVVARPSDGAAALAPRLGRHPGPLQPPFRAVPQCGPRRPRPRAGGAGGEDHHGRARVLGGARCAGGAAVECAGHRRHRAPGPAGRARRLRGGQRADGDDRWRRHGVVDRDPARGLPRRVHAGSGELRRRAGVVHGVRRGAVQPAGPRGLADRAGARAGRRHRRGDQRRGGCAAVAPRRARRRPSRVRRPVAGRERAPPPRAPGDPRRGVDRRRPEPRPSRLSTHAPGRWPRWRISRSSTAVVTSTVRPGVGSSSTPRCWRSRATASRSGRSCTARRAVADARAALDAEGAAVVTAVGGEADAVEASGVAAGARRPGVALAVPPVAGRLPGRATRAEGLPAAIGLVWVHEWLVLVGDRPR